MKIVQHSFLDGKVCRVCGEWWPIWVFAKNGKYRRGECKACANTIHRTYYENHREQSVAKAEAWRTKNRERYLELSRARDVRQYHANVEHSREEANQRFRERRKTRPWVGKAQKARRRARQQNAVGTFTAAEWKVLCEQYGNRCLRCGSTGRLTPDHVIPLSKGGTNYITNIQPLCYPCNCAKNDKIMDYR